MRKLRRRRSRGSSESDMDGLHTTVGQQDTQVGWDILIGIQANVLRERFLKKLTNISLSLHIPVKTKKSLFFIPYVAKCANIFDELLVLFGG